MIVMKSHEYMTCMSNMLKCEKSYERLAEDQSMRYQYRASVNEIKMKSQIVIKRDN